MRISVLFFTILRESTGKKDELLEFTESDKITVDSTLKFLANKYGKSFAEYVFDPQKGEVRGFLQFFINGQSITALDGLKTELHDGDILAIVPPVGGG